MGGDYGGRFRGDAGRSGAGGVARVTEAHYRELLEAAPPIKRDEMTRLLQFEPNPNKIAVAVFFALRNWRRP